MYLYLCTFLFLQALNTCKEARCKSNGASEKKSRNYKIDTRHTAPRRIQHTSRSPLSCSRCGGHCTLTSPVQWQNLTHITVGDWKYHPTTPLHATANSSRGPYPISSMFSRFSLIFYFPCSLLHLSSAALMPWGQIDNNGDRRRPCDSILGVLDSRCFLILRTFLSLPILIIVLLLPPPPAPMEIAAPKSDVLRACVLALLHHIAPRRIVLDLMGHGAHLKYMVTECNLGLQFWLSCKLHKCKSITGPYE